jgi:hypothetical protein
MKNDVTGGTNYIFLNYVANAEIIRELSKMYENVKIISKKRAKKLIFLGNSKP